MSPMANSRGLRRLSAYDFCLLWASFILFLIFLIFWLFWHQIRAQQPSVPNHFPTNGGPTPSTIQSFKRWHSNSWLISVVVCKLYKGIYFSQLPLKSNIHALSMSSNIWIVLSDCPSVCECVVVLGCNLVLKALDKLIQNLDKKSGSLSDTIF